MDQVLGVLLVFVILWVLIKALDEVFSERDKGKKAEVKLAKFLERHFDSTEYYIFQDVTVPAFKERTTQIDIVIISVFGIFVIENKYFSGTIFGKKEEPYWIQVFNKEKYFKFKNPIHQNFGHIKALQNLLNIPFENFFSVVVFSGSAKFGDYIDDVVSPGESLFLIKEKTKVIFSHEEVAAFVSRLKSERMEPGFETDKKHIETIRNRPECLLCGSSMVLRVTNKGSKRGREFWGCSRFPHCKGLKEKK
ncbi:MAG: NERD domain-containing protein [Desulforegulaceae bacterium]|nr:NERD domain-containing protein [Desulforegulaceae bacterium]